MIVNALIAHFLGDYYFQTEGMQKNKDNFCVLILHSLIYALTLTAVFAMYDNLPHLSLILSTFFITHLFIDEIKTATKRNADAKSAFAVYILDQLLHIIIICIVYNADFVSERLNPAGLDINYFINSLGIENFSERLLIFLVILKPASVLVLEVYALIWNEKNSLSNAVGAPNAGKTIGYLERVIIVLLYFLQQTTLIGLVLTAKSLARFKQLEDKNFAEKFIVGTLLSLCITVLMIVIYNNIT